MAIKSTSKKAPRVKSVGRKAKRVGREAVAEALGAERADRRAADRGSPAARFALKQELAHRLRSTGGRRGIAGTTRRQKIPIGEIDWTLLQHLADRLRSDAQSPTPGQVASVLLHRAIIEQMDELLDWLRGQLETRLREPSVVLWLFAEAAVRQQHFTDDADARQHLLSDARTQQREGTITTDLLRLLEHEAEALPRAFKRALEAVQMPLERAEQERVWLLQEEAR